jgi:hypothetical protein
MIKAVLAAVALLGLSLPAFAQDGGWRRYEDPDYGFSADLPVDFVPLEGAGGPGLTLAEADGQAQINLYGGPANGLTLEDFAATLASGGQRITYQAQGQSWFVLSGYYEPTSTSREPLVFYTKVLLSADQSRFSAFELSYPENEKARFDPLVERIEDSFTRPRS